MDDRDRARRCCDQGVEEMEKNSWRGDPETQRLRDEAGAVLKFLDAPRMK
jgi:hypothetical protein